MWFRVSPLVHFVCGMLRTVWVKILIHYKMHVTGCHCLIWQRFLFQNIACSYVSSFTKSSILKTESRRLLKYLQEFLCWMFLPLFFTHECVLCWIPLKYIFSQYFYSFFQPLLLLLHISLVWVPAPLDFVQKLQSFSYVHAIVFS